MLVDRANRIRFVHNETMGTTTANGYALLTTVIALESAGEFETPQQIRNGSSSVQAGLGARYSTPTNPIRPSGSG